MGSEVEAKEAAFTEVLKIIQIGQRKAHQVANAAMLETYWNIGGYLAEQVKSKKWGQSVVAELSSWLQSKVSGIRGFSPQNLWRMKQLFELYSEDPKLSPLVREIGWTQNCIIMAQCKIAEEREFYLKSAIKSGWSKAELEKQIGSSTFERTMISDKKLSPAVRELPQNVKGVFKDSYLLEFLGLPEQHQEKDLQSALVANLRQFLLELGDGFTYIGEKVRVQVGQKDFELDLLFFHRDLQCMVAFELKTGDFEPSHFGQLAFYLEALDRQKKRPHENPTIGVLLCKSKDDEVVEMALSRTLAPALVSEYQTKMIPKELLRQKLHEWTEMLEGEG